ncbi:GNAT family N-acetyltransferase [Oceanimonas baumannii]|uniref:GNAT family N-acetyltransferase n=1 Tax=Oceanimonas baumannii TaxID=129578 RepID=UPI001D1892A5|nr:GNAT family N-acetyltransferase [Oceanimonas baumannii]MCC4262857.1 GNAT family N-acetyltransferase [Oceanimonas baumannii]
MSNIQYIPLDSIAPEEMIPILNKLSTRKHLIAHEAFDLASVKSWINDKLDQDRLEGCIVRAIKLDGKLAGWCGIQPSDLGHEIAIVLDETCWGIGQSVFKSLILWANDAGLEVVYIHLLYTRPEYRFLRNISQRTFQTEMLGSTFTTYELNVSNFHPANRSQQMPTPLG